MSKIEVAFWRTSLAFLHVQTEVAFLEGRLFPSNHSFLNCSVWLDKSRLPKKLIVSITAGSVQA